MQTIPIPSPPNVFIEVRIRIRLDSRLKRAGMTDFGLAIFSTQQAIGNESVEIQPSRDDYH